ncbi:MAG TPA: YkvA family protein [bacterium]|nr:YkvA family protein [bacterium]
MRKLKVMAKELKKDLPVYQLALKDKRTPKLAKVLLGAAVFYARFRFDLIPDFIPIVGHLDDAVVVPFVIRMALNLIPEDVLRESRMRVEWTKNPPRRPKARSRRSARS